MKEVCASNLLILAITLVNVATKFVIAEEPCFGIPDVANAMSSFLDGTELSYLEQNELFESGQVIVFTCDSGWTLEGNGTVECLPEGVWSSQPICQENSDTMPPVVSTTSSPCPETVQIRNGTCSKVHTSANSTLSCSCKEGFRLANQTSGLTKCQNNQWINVPTCTALSSCPPLNITNGTCSNTSVTAFYEGSTLNCSCQFGYKLNGSSQITCQSSRRWTATPRCNRIPTCNGLPSIRNGTCTGMSEVFNVFTADSEVQCVCDDGFQGGGFAKCSSSGRWTNMPNCTANRRPSNITTCRGVPRMANGECIASGEQDVYAKDAFVTCLCDGNFDGSGRAKCGSNGNWTSIPVCKPKTTTPPPPTCESSIPIANGTCDTLAGEVYFQNSTVECNCNEGFGPFNTISARCNFTKWINVPRCVKQPSCKTLPTSANFTCESPKNYSGSNYQVNAIVNCSCNAGFSGKSAARCSGEDRWSNLPSCSVPPTCKSIPRIGNGTCSVENATTTSDDASESYQIGTKLTCRCDRLFAFSQSSAVVLNATCTSSGSWSRLASTKCSEVPLCKTLPELANGNCVSKRDLPVTVNEKITCSCQEGFRLNNSGRKIIPSVDLACRANGGWGNLPKCIPLR